MSQYGGGSEDGDDGYHLANASQYQGNSFYNYQPRVTIFEHKDFTRGGGGGHHQAQNRAAANPNNCCVDRCWSKAEIQGYCIKHYYEVNEQPEESVKSKKTEEEQRLLAEELYTTEKTYKAGLKAIVKGFIVRLQKYDEMGKPLITKDEITKGFLNIQDIYDLSRKFYNDLKNMHYTKTLLTPELGKTLLTYTPFFRLYTTYVNGYEEAATIVTKLRETNKEFEAFMQHCEKVEGNNIQAFMIMPVQRIPRYLMLLKGIMKATDPSEPLYANLKIATDQIEKVANEINTSIHMREARQRVISVQNHLENCTMPLVTPTRYHVKDGPLNKKYNNSSFKISSFNRYWFFLFNDMLMYTTVPNSKGDCKLKYILPLIDMTVHDIPDSTKPKIMNSFELKCPVKSITVTALSPTEKREWMETIQKHVTSVIANRATLKPITQAVRGVDPSPSPSSKSSSASSPPFHSNGSTTTSHSSTTPPITMGTVSIPPPIVPVLNRPQSMQNIHPASPPPPRTQYGGVAVHTKPVTPNLGAQARVGPPSGPPPPNQPRVPPGQGHSHTPSHSQAHASTPPPRPQQYGR